MRPAWGWKPGVVTALLSVGLAALGTSQAAAQSEPPPGSIAMRWNLCYGEGGAAARTFACNTNTGVEMLVISAFPPANLPQLNGAEVLVTLLSPGFTLPSWWQIGTGFCRTSTVVQGEFVPPSGPETCGDPWLNAGLGAVTYQYGSEGANIARLRSAYGINPPVAVTSGNEIFVCSFRILHQKTTGAGSCSGCSSGVCLGLQSVYLTQPAGVGNYFMIMPLPGTSSDVVTWQEDLVMPSSVYIYRSAWRKDFTGCVSTTEAARPTWGAIKRLYR